MMQTKHTSESGIHSNKESCLYRIEVGKKLSADFVERLGNLKIAFVQLTHAGNKVTYLEGVVQDQAQLSGILNTLCDYGAPILKVERMEPG